MAFANHYELTSYVFSFFPFVNIPIDLNEARAHSVSNYRKKNMLQIILQRAQVEFNNHLYFTKYGRIIKETTNDNR